MVLKIIAGVKEINPQPVVASDTTIIPRDHRGLDTMIFPRGQSLKSLVDTN